MFILSFLLVRMPERRTIWVRFRGNTYTFKMYILEVFDKSVVNVNDLVYFYKYYATMN